MLATIWNENSIERFDLQTSDGILTLKEKSIFLSGDKDFRPVALEADRRGNLFLSDWVLVNYPNHGRGRIWRIRPKEKSNIAPKGYFDYAKIDSTTAVSLLAKRESSEVMALLNDRRNGKTDQLPKYLSHASPIVKRAALVWAGLNLDARMLPLLDKTLEGDIDTPMFEAYLAAVENLSGSFAADYNAQKTPQAKQLTRHLDPNVLIGIARRADFSNQIRSLALRKLPTDQVENERRWIEPLLVSGSGELQLTAIRQLGQLRSTEPLMSLALDGNANAAARSEALLALSTLADLAPERLTILLDDNEPDVAIEAARTLRWHLDIPSVRQAFEKPLRSVEGELAEQIAFALNPADQERPTSVDDWKAALAAGGNPARGRRVFFTTQLMCSRCHSVDGSVVLLGPSLAGIAQSVSREQIIHSILRPSDQFPPQYQAWIVHTKDGASHLGLQLDHKSAGAIELLGLDGTTAHFDGDDVKDYEASPNSLMPQGLENLLSVSEFRNLLAFLNTLE